MTSCSGCICPTFTHILTYNENVFGTLKEIFGFFGFLGISIMCFTLTSNFFIKNHLHKISSGFLLATGFTSLMWIIYGIMIFSIQIIISQIIIIVCLLIIIFFKMYYFYRDRRLLERATTGISIDR